MVARPSSAPAREIYFSGRRRAAADPWADGRQVRGGDRLRKGGSEGPAEAIPGQSAGQPPAGQPAGQPWGKPRDRPRDNRAATRGAARGTPRGTTAGADAAARAAAKPWPSPRRSSWAEPVENPRPASGRGPLSQKAARTRSARQ